MCSFIQLPLYSGSRKELKCQVIKPHRSSKRLTSQHYHVYMLCKRIFLKVRDCVILPRTITFISERVWLILHSTVSLFMLSNK